MDYTILGTRRTVFPCGGRIPMVGVVLIAGRLHVATAIPPASKVIEVFMLLEILFQENHRKISGKFAYNHGHF